MQTNTQESWVRYVTDEKARITPYLRKHGFELDDIQPQTIGERYLTRPIGGGRKVVFFGKRLSDNLRVVIKTSHESGGIVELKLERQSREMLARIDFAYQIFSSPKELLFDPAEGVLITEYIEQERPFLERSLKEQFSIVLKALKAQEGAHATAAAHWSQLKKMMGSSDYSIKAGEYKKIAQYAHDIANSNLGNETLRVKLERALYKTVELIEANEKILDRYGDFLTHWDFIPQNFRIRNDQLYLLDHSSIRFGNKYEGWARLINFMTLYNPPLATALVRYVALNRPDEQLALKMMRAYRLVELIRYYTTWLSQTENNLHALTRARIDFWTEVLMHVLDDTAVPSETIESYKALRDSLRSEDEKIRQQGLH